MTLNFRVGSAESMRITKLLRLVIAARKPHSRAEAEKLLEAEELLSDTTAFLAAHCMLLLATAVHFTPTLKPYGHLLWLMRGIAVLLLACGSLRCVKFLHEATFCVSPIL